MRISQLTRACCDLGKGSVGCIVRKVSERSSAAADFCEDRRELIRARACVSDGVKSRNRERTCIFRFLIPKKRIVSFFVVFFCDFSYHIINPHWLGRVNPHVIMD